MDYGALILSALLDKWEKSSQYGNPRPARRPVLPVRPQTLPDYFLDHTARYREAIHQAVAELERERLVEVRWERFAEGVLLDRLFLRPENAARAYQWLGRTPRSDKEDRLRATLEECAAAASGWACAFYDFLRREMAAGRYPGAYLPAGDQEAAEKLLRAVNALAALQEEVPRRLFSLRVLGNSKALAGIQGRLARIARDFAGLPESEPGLVLEQLGLVENPQHVFLGGRAVLRVDGRLLNLEEFFPDLGFASASLRRLEIAGIPADYIVSVENLTSYYEFLARRHDRYLAVYLGGYPGPARREFLARLARWTDARGSRPAFFHWGDLDYGGFSIFHHLRETAVPHLRPLWMDEAILHRYRAYGSPLSPGYARRLARLAEDPAYAAFHPVLRAMLRENLRLEQECIAVEAENVPL